MANGTTSPSTIASVLGAAAYRFSLLQPHLPVYMHMVISSILPIYAGAHASLSRPNSAAKPPSSGNPTEHGDEDSEDEQSGEEEESAMEGLTPGDALLFPIMAGIMLTALYILIKWLNDPAILNTVLGWYFAGFGVLGTTRLLSDFLCLGHEICFPVRYVSRGVLWKLDFGSRKTMPLGIHEAKVKDAEHFVKECEMEIGFTTDKLKGDLDPAERMEEERRLGALMAKLQKAKSALKAEKGVQPKKSPLPGRLSHLDLPKWLNGVLWNLADLPRQKVILKVNVKQKTVLSTTITLFTIFSVGTSFITTIYFNTVSKPWYLTNLFGFSFSYGALQMMSPTTFSTGALLLSALFFYDIYMVFFTPMMVTVAKSLDIPVKLVFPRPKGGPGGMAMLGLGDIVLPGIMIGLALRFDLSMHYLRQQTAHRSRNSDGVVRTELVKSVWRPVSGRWADIFWLHSTKPVAGVKRPSTEFAKPYFHACLVGYVTGLTATIAAMHISGHGQPALLYLVPSVLGALIVTALWRQETRMMWEFSEEIEEEVEESLVQKGKEVVEKVKEVRQTGLFRKAFFGVLSNTSPSDKKLDNDKSKDEGNKGPSRTTSTKPKEEALKYSRSNSLSSSWGSAESDPDLDSTSPLVPKQRESNKKTERSAVSTPIRSPVLLRNVLARGSVHGDANTFFSITLNLPGRKGIPLPRNWKETVKGDEILAPSSKRQRTAL